MTCRQLSSEKDTTCRSPGFTLCFCHSPVSICRLSASVCSSHTHLQCVLPYPCFSPFSVVILGSAAGVLLQLLCNSGICLQECFSPLQQLLNPNRPCSRASQVFVAGRSSWGELFPVCPCDSSRWQPSKAAVDGEQGPPLLTASVGGIRVDEPSPGLFIYSREPLW